jgi:hypothetical protein
MPHPDRIQLIALLKRLEGSDEKDVLEASRAIARSIKDSGVSWEELLAASADETRDAETAGSDAGEALSAEETAEARSVIEALLAMDGISDTTRGEIGDLRGDLDEGRFGKADLRYVRALRARLS